MRLEPVIGDDPRDILRALKSALHGAGPALGLGLVSTLPGEVRAGTAVVVTTSGSTGVPKSVVLSRDALTASAMATADRVGEGAWLLALPASYVAGMQVLVRSIVSDREPAILSGSFTAQSFAAAAHMMVSTDRGAARPDVHLARSGAAGEAAGCRRARRFGPSRAALVRDDPGRRAGAPAAHPRARPERGSPGGPHLRLDRDERRMRLRRHPAARGLGPGRGRRGAARGADARRRLPRRPRDDGCRLPAHRGRHAVVPHRRRRHHRGRTCCGCAAASTTSSSRAA